MDTGRFKKLKTIVQQALLLPEEERPAFVSRECGDDGELRAEVEGLLAQPPDDDLDVVRQDIAEVVDFRAAGRRSRPKGADQASPGDREGRVGPYKLLEKVGEGGMGEVWVAEQTEPVRRRVALKVIKPGMDSDRILARFEAERQALAMMEHAAIARVFDAGQTPTSVVSSRVDATCSATTIPTRWNRRRTRRRCITCWDATTKPSRSSSRS